MTDPTTALTLAREALSKSLPTDGGRKRAEALAAIDSALAAPQEPASKAEALERYLRDVLSDGTVNEQGVARVALRLLAAPSAQQEPRDPSEASGVERIWECKIGGRMDTLPPGADAPMRNAIEAAFEGLTGYRCEFNFSGWGGKLDELERAVVNKDEAAYARTALAQQESVDEACSLAGTDFGRWIRRAFPDRKPGQSFQLHNMHSAYVAGGNRNEMRHAELASREAQPSREPEWAIFQHQESARTTCVPADSKDWFAGLNASTWFFIGYAARVSPSAAPQPSADGPGSPARRFDALLQELEKRFPDPEPYSAQAPEGRYVAMIDARLSTQPTADRARLAFTAAHVEYIQMYGGRCRDCADNDGVCPSSGLPCGGSEKAIRRVLDALAYGVNHGYITLAASEPKPQEERASEAVRLRCLLQSCRPFVEAHRDYCLGKHGVAGTMNTLLAEVDSALAISQTKPQEGQS